MKVKLLVIVAALFCILAASCASTDSQINEVSTAPLAAVVVSIDGVETGFDNLADAIKYVSAGQTAIVTVNQDLNLTTKIDIDNKVITIIDGGLPVTLTDAIAMENFVEYNSNDVVCAFRVINNGKLILKGTETGGLTFMGAGSSASATARIMFYLGTGWKDPAKEISGYLEFNKGVTVTNIYSTIFGGLVRAYGELVINGGVFTNNYVKGNGLFTSYYKTTINDCEVTNNDTANVGIFQLCSCDTVETVVNGGTFENNTSAKRAAVFNTYALGKFTLNGGIFKNNTVYAEGAGGAIYIVSANNINGGLFENNASCDIFVDKTAVEGLNKVDSVVANVIDNTK
jgi:hypothetical protein